MLENPMVLPQYNFNLPMIRYQGACEVCGCDFGWLHKHKEFAGMYCGICKKEVQADLKLDPEGWTKV